MDDQSNISSDNFSGDPFCNVRDSLLHDLNMASSSYFSGAASTSTDDELLLGASGGTHIIGCHKKYKVLAEEVPHKSPSGNVNMFSRIQISPGEGNNSPVLAASPSPRGFKAAAMVPSDIINANSSNSCLIDNTGPVQISSPRNRRIKRRKRQTKKVVCIPAPGAPNSRPSEEVVPSDLWAWRKYGQKPIKGSSYPREYYRCIGSKGCSARKQVERSRTDPNMLIITYTSEHNHPWPTQRNALAESTRSQPPNANNNDASKTSPTASPQAHKTSKENQKESSNETMSPTLNVASSSTGIKEERKVVINALKRKKKVGIKVRDKNSGLEALKIAVGFSGVQSAALGGQDETLIEVEVVDRVYAVELTTWLRKKLGYAELLSVAKYEPQVLSQPYVNYPSRHSNSVPDHNVVDEIDDKHGNKVQYMMPKVDEEVSKPIGDIERERQSVGNDPRTCRGSQVHIPETLSPTLNVASSSTGIKEEIDTKHLASYRMWNDHKEVPKPIRLFGCYLWPVTERERRSIENDPPTCQGLQVHIPGSSFDCLSSEGEKNRGDSKLLKKLNYSGYSILLQLPRQFNEKLNEIILVAQPSRPLALCFCAEILVEISLSYTNDRQLWPGRQHFVNLEVLDLHNSNLTRLPDLSEANKLRRLNLQGCKILVDVSSIQHLSKVQHLNLKGCTSVRSLPSLTGLKFLSSLDLSDCSNLKRLPLSLGCLSSLAILDVRNCKRLHHIPTSILRLQSLHSLDISGCLNLVKLMTGNQMVDVLSTVAHSSSFHQDEFVLGSSIHSSIKLQSNWVNHDLLLAPDGGSNLKDQQREYLSAVMVSNSTPKTEDIGAIPQVEAPLLDQPVIQHSLKRSLNLPEEERSSNTVDVWEEPSLKRRTSSETKSQNSQQSSATEGESSNRTPSLSILQVRKALEGYMNMSLEDIHQAAAFEDIENLVKTLIQQASNLPDRAGLEGLLCCVQEYKMSVPDTMLCLNTTQTHKTWLQVKLTRVDVRLVQAEDQCHSLQDRLTTLCEEEEELEAEIQRLLAKKKELLDQQNSFSSH